MWKIIILSMLGIFVVSMAVVAGKYSMVISEAKRNNAEWTADSPPPAPVADLSGLDYSLYTPDELQALEYGYLQVNKDTGELIYSDEYFKTLIRLGKDTGFTPEQDRLISDGELHVHSDGSLVIFSEEELEYYRGIYTLENPQPVEEWLNMPESANNIVNKWPVASETGFVYDVGEYGAVRDWDGGAY